MIESEVQSFNLIIDLGTDEQAIELWLKRIKNFRKCDSFCKVSCFFIIFASDLNLVCIHNIDYLIVLRR